MSLGPLTAYTETTAALFTAIKTQLDTWGAANWKVYKYQGTSIEGLFEWIPNATLPAAFICYSDSEYYVEKQRRQVLFNVVVAAVAPQDTWDDGVVTAFTLARKAIELLDYRIISGDAFIYTVSDEALDLGPTLSVISVLFMVKDH